MAFRKITHGWVTQIFDNQGNCTSQNFFAGDTVEYEDAEGNPSDEPDNEQYQPFDMVQPGEKGLVVSSNQNGILQIRTCNKDNYEELFRVVCQQDIPHWGNLTNYEEQEVVNDGVFHYHGHIVAVIWLDPQGNYQTGI